MISHVETVGFAMDVAVAGNYAYVADDEVGLQVVDVSAINEVSRRPTHVAKQPERKLPGLAVAYNPHHISSVHDQPHLGKTIQAYRLTVKDDLAYIAAWGAWQIVDVLDPPVPKGMSLQYTEGGTYAFDIAAAGDYAYIANGRNGVRIIDVSNPAAPVEVSAYVLEDGYVRGLTVVGNYLYVAGSGEGLYVVDASGSLNPIEISTYAVPLFAWDVEVAGNLAFVVWNLREADGGPSRECKSGISIIDVSTPETSVELGSHCDPNRDGVSDVAVADNYIYVAAGIRGLRVLDISNPALPTEVGFYDTPYDAYSVTTAGDYIYVADVDGGLFILRFAPN
jgi:hypothetical protein